MARLFIALWPPAHTRDELAAWRDRWRWPRGATPVASERLHTTLHFLGEVANERQPALRAALRVQFSAFTLDFGAAALWPHGIAVLEPFSCPDGLSDLHGLLGAALLRLDLPVDPRPYRPHVTMARRAAGAAPPADPEALRWEVGEFALMSSTPGPGGGYATLQRYGPSGYIA